MDIKHAIIRVGSAGLIPEVQEVKTMSIRASEYLRHPFKSFYLPLTIFTMALWGVVAYMTLEVTQKLYTNGHPMGVAMVAIGGVIIILGSLYLYAWVSQMIKP